VEYNEVNIDQLAEFKAGSVVSPETLEEARLLRDARNPVVVLGRGELKVALTVHAHRVSKSAKSKIEAAGGQVQILEI
jgi:large subunit ribosomal protein L15